MGIISETTGLKALSLPRLRRGPLPFTEPRAVMVSETIPIKFSCTWQHFHNFIVTFAEYGYCIVQGVGGGGSTAV